MKRTDHDPIPRVGRCLSPSLVVLLLAIIGCGSASDSLEDAMNVGEEALAEGDLPAARIDFLRALQIDPNHAPAHRGLSRVYEGQGRFGDALWELQETVRLDPGASEERFRLASYAAVGGHYEDALAETEVLLLENPENRDALVLRAAVLEAMGDLASAERAYRDAVDLVANDHTLRAYGAFLLRRHRRLDAEPILRRHAALGEGLEGSLRLAVYLDEDPATRAEAAELFERLLAEADHEQWAVVHEQVFYRQVARDEIDAARSTLLHGILGAADDAQREALTLLAARFEAGQGRLDEAIAFFERLVERNPESPRPHLIRSVFYELRDDLDSALSAAWDAEKKAPESLDVQLRVVELLSDVGHRDRIDEYLRMAAERITSLNRQHPDSELAQLIGAEHTWRSGDIAAAEAVVREVVARWPGSGPGHHILGEILAVRGDHENAEVVLERAVALEPWRTAARRRLALVRFERGDVSAAERMATQVFLSNPEDSEMLLLVVQARVAQGRVDDAMLAIEAVSEDDRDVSLNYADASLRARIGDWPAARAALGRANRQRPDRADILLALHEADQQLGRGAASLRRFQKDADAQATNPAIQSLWGRAALLSDEKAQAEVAFRRALDLDPADYESLLDLVGLLVHEGRAGEARGLLEHALEAAPRDARLYDRMGELEALEDPERAIALFERALELDPASPSAQNNLSYLLAERRAPGDLDRARVFSASLTADGATNPDYHDTHGLVLWHSGRMAEARKQFARALDLAEHDHPNRGWYLLHLARLEESADGPSAAVEPLREAVASLRWFAKDEPPWADTVRAELRRLRREGAMP